MTLYAYSLWADGKFPYEVATDDEVKLGHPKCRTCRFALEHEHGGKFCSNPSSPYSTPPEPQLNVDEDYCRHHNQKEKPDAEQWPPQPKR